MAERSREDAVMEAAAGAGELLDAGDLEGCAIWHRILDAVERLQATKPAEGEKVQ